MLSAGLANSRQQTSVDIGDKTMMGALAPMAEALQQHQSEGLQVVFERAAQAAAAGSASSRDMMAKFGRARHLGQRVIPHLDVGASSMATIFHGLSQSLAR